MKIGIGNDHHGLIEKKIIIDYFKNNNIEYVDFGTNVEDNTDYIDYAEKVSNAVINKEIKSGILICGTGIGMCIAANKFKGIRCARVLTEEDARITRLHNDANIMAIPESIEKDKIIKIVDTFINTEFSSEERHIRRREKLDNL